MKLLGVLSLLGLLFVAGCERQEADIEALGPAGEIPNRPGLYEQLTGKKLGVGF